METIRNYLESMFAALPHTPEVLHAKQELLQMMEDKYTELLGEGRPQNEAVGIVISEFGNLDELAETLGIGKVVSGFTQPERRQVTREEARDYILDRARHMLFIGIGVMLCILSVTGPVAMDAIGVSDALGASSLFLFIAGGVALFIISGVYMQKWEFLKKTPCTIDYATAEYVQHEWENNRLMHSLLLTLGILLCILCFIPLIILTEDFPAYFGRKLTEALGVVLMFLFIGIGVLLIIVSGGKNSACKTLLSLNDAATVSGSYASARKVGEQYENPTLNAVMSLYWKIILCLYLIWSFLSFRWYLTWIIWPVAAIIHSLIRSIYGRRDS